MGVPLFTITQNECSALLLSIYNVRIISEMCNIYACALPPFQIGTAIQDHTQIVAFTQAGYSRFAPDLNQGHHSWYSAGDNGTHFTSCLPDLIEVRNTSY